VVPGETLPMTLCMCTWHVHLTVLHLGDSARCDCPVGFEGPDCSVLKYPDCMPDPAAPRAWCGTWHPKSCECVRQCKAVLCPEGNCRYHYDWAGAKCFERSNVTSPQAAPAAALTAANASLARWKGGSDIPPEADTSVTYYSGAERGPDPAAGVITRCVLGPTLVVGWAVAWCTYQG
jgi:hypothetical protein